MTKRKRYTFKIVIEQEPDSTNFGSKEQWAQNIEFTLKNWMSLANVVEVKPIRNNKH